MPCKIFCHQIREIYLNSHNLKSMFYFSSYPSLMFCCNCCECCFAFQNSDKHLSSKWQEIAIKVCTVSKQHKVHQNNFESSKKNETHLWFIKCLKVEIYKFSFNFSS